MNRGITDQQFDRALTTEFGLFKDAQSPPWTRQESISCYYSHKRQLDVLFSYAGNANSRCLPCREYAASQSLFPLR
ncbi:hypothetical protein A0H81_03542 [Grifola frondosa]|uniref:Uncharacterized protein n=1 Tax=Grifola frondosa TaxID=5627 RepID=A0A1C7MJP0_GRIFR|nr:hypothetical protein A0H81_03542 [Grifola frondosa]